MGVHHLFLSLHSLLASSSPLIFLSLFHLFPLPLLFQPLPLKLLSLPFIHHLSTRAKVLCLDWWFHSCFPLHLPGHVDHQAGVRRGRTIHCPPKVLLNWLACAARVVCM